MRLGSFRNDVAPRYAYFHETKTMTKKKNLGGRPSNRSTNLRQAAPARKSSREGGEENPQAAGAETGDLETADAWPAFGPDPRDTGFRPAPGSRSLPFDPKAANRALEFFETKLRHVEGAVAGKPFKLERWQQAIVANLFGWLRKDDFGRTVRRFREAFFYVPRKNGKSPLAAGIALYGLFMDNEPGAQIVLAASKRDQAALLFRHCRGMVEREPTLSEAAQVFGGIGQRAIVLRADSAAGLKVISSEAGGEHGGNVSLAIVDELHAQPNRDLVDVIQTSMASANRAQPLLIHITTADFARESICNEKHEYACRVRDGQLPDAAFLPVVYEAHRDSNWTDPEVQAAANPNIGVSVSREYLARECARAQETPTYENTFKRLHLNMKTEVDVRWLPMDKWDAGGSDDPMGWRTEALAELAGESCMGGLDLSTTTDVTAFVLAFRRGTTYIALPFFWLPSESAHQRERRDRVPYVNWPSRALSRSRRATWSITTWYVATSAHWGSGLRFAEFSATAGIRPT